jgi:hypothetical protein
MPMSWHDYIPSEDDKPYPTPVSQWVPVIALAVLIAAIIVAFAILT